MPIRDFSNYAKRIPANISFSIPLLPRLSEQRRNLRGAVRQAIPPIAPLSDFHFRAIYKRPNRNKIERSKSTRPIPHKDPLENFLSKRGHLVRANVIPEPEYASGVGLRHKAIPVAAIRSSSIAIKASQTSFCVAPRPFPLRNRQSPESPPTTRHSFIVLS
jgi:hypothetical protein